MATKSERFKAEQQRAAQAAPVDAKTLPGPAPGKQPRRKGPHSTYEHEVSASARPSRKSSRKSPAHIKTDATLRMTVVNRNASPKNRAARRGGPN
ncbi:MAG TPA: hypothetical protein VFH68_04365 [Polyangia bacterium]|jgi:hypothetical protein|nr:hypothetical protein [Polyangia bacterium]